MTCPFIYSEHTPRPIGADGWGSNLNFDNLLVAAQANKGVYAYIQILRSGFIEAVEALTLEPKPSQHTGQPPARIIPSIAWEKRIIEAVPSYLKALEKLRLPPPYVASISLLNFRHYIMYVGPTYDGHGPHPVDRDHLLADEILIESITESPDRLLRPLFDQIWNACGWLGSINYDEAGKWTERR